MDKDTQKIIDQVAVNSARLAVAQVHEFYIDNMKVLGERIDMGFEIVNKKLEDIDLRVGRVENALATLLREFKEEREKVDELKKQISELTIRVQVLEKQLTTAQ